jgi:flavodoxin
MTNQPLKKLVVYYSLEDNTRFMAEAIAEAAGAEILRIKPKRDLNPKGFVKYLVGMVQVLIRREPALQPFDQQLRAYDVIFVGTPVWGGNLTPAMNTLLRRHIALGKKMALFCSYAGDSGKVFPKLEKLLLGNEFIGEIGLKEPLKGDKNITKEKIQKWVSEVLEKV